MYMTAGDVVSSPAGGAATVHDIEPPTVAIDAGQLTRTGFGPGLRGERPHDVAEDEATVVGDIHCPDPVRVNDEHGASLELTAPGVRGGGGHEKRPIIGGRW